MIIDAGHGEGFCVGNIMKYAMRCGKKGRKRKRAIKDNTLCNNSHIHREEQWKIKWGKTLFRYNNRL